MNTTIGGRTLAFPGYTLTAPNMAVNGGFNFDAVLGALTMSQNRAVSYASANTQMAGRGLINAATNVTGGFKTDFTKEGAVSVLPAMSAIDALANINSAAITAGSAAFLTGAQVQAKAVDSGGGLCFITTAVAEAVGLPDDCEALTTLRKWRDDVLPTMPGGAALIRVYYAIAPHIVDTLKKHKAGASIFNAMRTAYILPAVEKIKAGDNAGAFHDYCELVDFSLQAAIDCEKWGV
jgi:hypothetical protein